MNLTELCIITSFDDMGQKMHDLMSKLFPIYRAITENSVRETLKRINQLIPLETHEVPAGTQILDWVAPKQRNTQSTFDVVSM